MPEAKSRKPNKGQKHNQAASQRVVCPIGLCHSSQLHGGTNAGWQLQRGRVCVLLPRVCDFCVPLTFLFANKEKEGEEAFC